VPPPLPCPNVEEPPLSMLFDSRDTQQQQNKAVCENGDELC